MLADALSAMPSPLRGALAGVVDSLMPVSYGNLTLGYRARKFVNGLDTDPVIRNHRWLGTFAPHALPGLVNDFDPAGQRDLQALFKESSTVARGRGPLETLLRDDQRFYLQDQVLAKVDRASMACSLEVRPPFLSEALVRFARSLPASLKVGGGRHKRLLREWVSRRYPSEISERPKKGFGAPLGMWFRGPLRELVGDILSPSVIRRQGLLRDSAVTRLVEDHWSGRADRRKEIFNLMTFGLWLDQVASRAGSGSLNTVPAAVR